MIITHAVIGSAGSALLLLAALGLLVGVVVLAAATHARSARRRDVPDAVPLWWDQSPTESASAGTPAESTPA